MEATQKKKVMCDTCGAQMSCLDALRSHKFTIHGEGKGFRCKTCGRTFYSKTFFEDHVAGHLNLKRHKCGICKREFTMATGLSRHRRNKVCQKIRGTVFSAEPIQHRCPTCGERFSSKKKLQEHKKAKHRIDHHMSTTSKKVPSLAAEAVLVESQPMPEGSETVKGYDFNKGVDHHELLKSFKYCGFQATNFGLAVEEINKMIECKKKAVPESAKVNYFDRTGRDPTNCTIFLGYTSNMISAGVRDTIRFLVQHNMVDCIVSSAGGVEEDFIKCLAPTYLGRFDLVGKELRKKGFNRIGNLVVPNDNYVKFEEFLIPILDKMLEEQQNDGTLWTPSKMIHRLGKEIDNPESVYYWAYKNNIPVYSPALTDGSIGDMLYFHSVSNPGLVLDIIQDIQMINSQSVKAVNTGMIIIGGGLIKHHICNANLMRNGADFSVFVNTASEFDGSDSGARPDEAVSWGKIKMDATPVKVYGEATLIFPLLVAETFARDHHQNKKEVINDQNN